LHRKNDLVIAAVILPLKTNNAVKKIMSFIKTKQSSISIQDINAGAK
jgi:hypothetical protein